MSKGTDSTGPKKKCAVKRGATKAKKKTPLPKKKLRALKK